MNQGRLEVVKQETARVNVNILGISELKWTGMGEFTQGRGNLVGCYLWGRTESDTTEVTSFTHSSPFEFADS